MQVIGSQLADYYLSLFEDAIAELVGVADARPGDLTAAAALFSNGAIPPSSREPGRTPIRARITEQIRARE